MTRGLLIGAVLLIALGVVAMLLPIGETDEAAPFVGIEDRPEVVESEPGEPPVEVSETAEVRVLGQCVDVHGEPLAGCSVAVTPRTWLRMSARFWDVLFDDPAEPVHCTTDSAGRFECQAAPLRSTATRMSRLHVVCSAPGCSEVSGYLSFPRTGGALDLGRIELLPGARLRASVVDENDEPVDGLRIVIRTSAPGLDGKPHLDERQATTSFDGSLFFVGRDLLPLGSWPIDPGEGFELLEPKRLVVRGDSNLVEPRVRLRRRGEDEQIFGVVLDALGRRVAGASVEVDGSGRWHSERHRHVQTDRYGQFSVFRRDPAQRDAVRLRIWGAGRYERFAPFLTEPIPWGRWEHLVYLDRDVESPNVVEPALRTLRVQLVDKEGQAVEGSTVELIEAMGQAVRVGSLVDRSSPTRAVPNEGRSQGWPIAWSQADTDAQGFVELRCPEVATELVVRLRGAEHAPDVVPVLGFPATDDVLRVEVIPAGHLVGRLGPLAALRHFQRMPGFPVEMRPLGLSVGLARPGAGKDPTAPHFQFGDGVVDPFDGSFSIDGIASGVWALHLHWPVPGTPTGGTIEHLDEPIGSVLVRAGESTQFQADLSTTQLPAVIRGTVHRAGRPLAHARIRLHGRRSPEGRLEDWERPITGWRTDGRGRFTIGALMPGHYRVEAQPLEDATDTWIPAGSVDVSWGSDLERVFDVEER